MDDAVVVGVLDTGEDLAHDLDRLPHRQPALDEVLERGALDVLHGDVVGPVDGPAVEDPDDIRVLEAGG